MWKLLSIKVGHILLLHLADEVPNLLSVVLSFGSLGQRAKLHLQIRSSLNNALFPQTSHEFWIVLVLQWELFFDFYFVVDVSSFLSLVIWKVQDQEGLVQNIRNVLILRPDG